MNYYKVETSANERIIQADSCKFIREKGGYCRYEFYRNGATVATFSANFVFAITELK